MTEQDLEIESLRTQNAELKKTLKSALKDLDYILCQFEMCQICAYADADCEPEQGSCIPKWRGLA
ncbi:MAG: hypothetical protein J6S14_19450 [Clostridia bacterium]|nr:hypothetical protein [Clostridia bacterium]